LVPGDASAAELIPMKPSKPVARPARRALAFLGVLAGLAGLLLYRAEVIILVAEGELPVGNSPSKAPIGADLVGVMVAGDRAEVIDCESTKSDLVINLRLQSGQAGYVAGGPYVLERTTFPVAALLSSPRQITFSCRGMFEHRRSYPPSEKVQ
jgi:hypothetical protein